MKLTRASRFLAVPLVALTASCSAFLVQPVVNETLDDGTVRPTCLTNSYVWPALDTAVAALFAVLPVLALREHQEQCDNPSQECSTTGALVILWGLGAPIWGGSAYFGYRGVNECTSAGSPSRWSRWKPPPPPKPVPAGDQPPPPLPR